MNKHETRTLLGGGGPEPGVRWFRSRWYASHSWRARVDEHWTVTVAGGGENHRLDDVRRVGGLPRGERMRIGKMYCHGTGTAREHDGTTADENWKLTAMSVIDGLLSTGLQRLQRSAYSVAVTRARDGDGDGDEAVWRGGGRVRVVTAATHARTRSGYIATAYIAMLLRSSIVVRVHTLRADTDTAVPMCVSAAITSMRPVWPVWPARRVRLGNRDGSRRERGARYEHDRRGKGGACVCVCVRGDLEDYTYSCTKSRTLLLYSEYFFRVIFFFLPFDRRHRRVDDV